MPCVLYNKPNVLLLCELDGSTNLIWCRNVNHVRGVSAVGAGCGCVCGRITGFALEVDIYEISRIGNSTVPLESAVIYRLEPC